MMIMRTAPGVDMGGFVIPEWDFHDRLRKARHSVGMTQSEFAEQLEVKVPTYGSYETGPNKPRDLIAFARRVEMVTRVPAAWLLGLDSQPVTMPARASSSMAELRTFNPIGASRKEGVVRHLFPTAA